MQMLTKKGKKTEKLITDGTRSKKKGQSKFRIPKHLNMEEQVVKEKVVSFKNMKSS